MAVLGVKKHTLVSAPRNRPRTPYLECSLDSASHRPVYVSSAAAGAAGVTPVKATDRWT